MKRKEPGKSVLAEALKFIVLIAIITAGTYGALEYTPLRGVAAAYTAYASLFLLQSFGYQPAEIIWLENPHIVSAAFDAELISLCFGTLEMALWTGVVFASMDKSLRRRIFGFFSGILLFLFFNPVRIAVTLKFFDASRPFASEIVHDLLFRASLLALFVAAYAIWYTWPEGTEVARKRKTEKDALNEKRQ